MLTPAEIEEIRTRHNGHRTCVFCSEPATGRGRIMGGDPVYLCDRHGRDPDYPLLTQEERDIAALLNEVERLRAMVPAPVAPQVIRLHQAWEGTTSCLHCGEPMPWADMEVCPRGQAERVPVEWRDRGGGVEEATPGDFALTVHSEGWAVEFINRQAEYVPVDNGPQTGPEGKSKAVVAWQRACGGAP